jgi:hypothetical protein
MSEVYTQYKPFYVTSDLVSLNGSLKDSLCLLISLSSESTLVVNKELEPQQTKIKHTKHNIKSMFTNVMVWRDCECWLQGLAL